MRVFVTGTGRCGTVTFNEACKHIKNFTTWSRTKKITRSNSQTRVETCYVIRKC